MHSHQLFLLFLAPSIAIAAVPPSLRPPPSNRGGNKGGSVGSRAPGEGLRPPGPPKPPTPPSIQRPTPPSIQRPTPPKASVTPPKKNDSPESPAAGGGNGKDSEGEENGGEKDGGDGPEIPDGPDSPDESTTSTTTATRTSTTPVRFNAQNTAPPIPDPTPTREVEDIFFDENRPRRGSAAPGGFGDVGRTMGMAILVAGVVVGFV